MGVLAGWAGSFCCCFFLNSFVSQLSSPTFVSHKAILGDKKGDARSAANSSGQRIYNSHPAFLLQRLYEGLTGKPVWGTRTIVLDVLAGCLCISRSISVHLSLSFLLCVVDSRCMSESTLVLGVIPFISLGGGCGGGTHSEAVVICSFHLHHRALYLNT